MKRNYLILLPIFILYFISIIFLPSYYKIKQLIWIFISIISFFVVSKLKYKGIIKLSSLLYIISIILLLLLLILNKFTNGSRAWLNIGFISFQPSELMKVSLILFSINYLNKLSLWGLLLVYLFPMILIYLEPDTGAVIMIGIILLVFLNLKLNRRQLIKFYLFMFIIIFIFISLLFLEPDILIKMFGESMFYRINRIKSFGNNLQTTNALISIATSNTLYFPEMFNDFYISYILSKNIFLIIPIVISSILIIIFISKKNTVISIPVFYLLLWQFWWNLAMNLSLVPVIGIPYPFISYGGTHIIITMILISLSLKKSNDNMVYIHNNMKNILKKDKNMVVDMVG